MVECKDTLGRTIPAYQMVGHKSNRMTAIGINNKGQLVLSYGLEDTDTIDGSLIYNAADNALWYNLRDAYKNGTDFMSAFTQAGSAFNANYIINKFYNYQKIRPEALMIVDAEGKYDKPVINSGDTSYLTDMELGEKIDQRHLFLTFQQKYFASKYNNPATAPSIPLMNLTSFPTGSSSVGWLTTVDIVPYSDIYVQWVRDNTEIAKVRAKHDVITTIDVSSAAPSSGEVAQKIISIDSIKSISSLARAYPSLVAFGTASKLQTIRFDDASAGYVANPNLTALSVQAAPMAKIINLQGQSGLTAALNLTNNPDVTEINTVGTSYNDITIAAGSPLTTCRLGSKVRKITAKNLRKVTLFQMESYSLIEDIRVENCVNIPLEQILANSSRKIQRIRLTNVNLTFDDCSMFKPVIEGDIQWQGYDASGATPAGLNGVIYGNIYFGNISDADMQKMYDYFGEDPTGVAGINITRGGAKDIHKVEYFNTAGDGETIIGNPLYIEYIVDGNRTTDPVPGKIAIPTYTPTEPYPQYRYQYSSWNFQFTTPITEDKRILAQYTKTVNSYPATFKNYDDTTLYTVLIPWGEYATFDMSYLSQLSRENMLCTGFYKQGSTQVPDISFLVQGPITLLPLYDTIAVPQTSKRLSNMTWAEVVAVCNNGKISSTDPTTWVTEAEGVETAWFHLQKRGFIEDEDTKTVVCYNGDTYKIQPVGYLQDRYTEDQGVNYKPIPVTFGTVNLANIEMVYKQSISEPFGWSGSAIRTYLNGSNTNNDGNFLVTREGENGTESHVWRSSSNGQTVNEDAPYISNLPMDLQQAIQICCKQNMIPSPDTFTWDSITYDKLFVPSALEVGDPGTIQIFARNFVERDPEVYPGALEKNRQLPQITYSIFGSAGTTGQSSRQKYKYGTSTLTGWWTRHSSYQGEAVNVISGGQMIGQEGTYYKYIYFIKDYRSVQSFPIYFCMGTPKET